MMRLTLKVIYTRLKEILMKSKDFKSQVELIKNKEFIFEKIDKMAKKYDKIIWKHIKPEFRKL